MPTPLPDELPTKLPPHSLEAEQAVLGSMLLEREASAAAMMLLDASDFYRATHRALFSAIATQVRLGEPADLVTMADRLREGGLLDEIGGRAYLLELCDAVATAANVRHYCAIVRRKATLRGLLEVSSEIQNLVYGDAYDGDDQVVNGTVAVAISMVLGVAQDNRTLSWVSLGDAVNQDMPLLEQQRTNAHEGGVLGIPTGLAGMDSLTLGMQPGELNILSGRPGDGKSSVALNWALHAAQQGFPVAFFSLEMAQFQVVVKALGLKAGVNTHSLRSGFLSQANWERVLDSAQQVQGLPLYIMDAGDVDLSEMEALARMAQLQFGAKLVVIDYLQKIDVPGVELRHMVIRVSEIARRLKNMAKALGVSVLALSQMPRPEKGRENARPTIHDQGWSAQVEREADTIVLIWRKRERREQDTPGAPTTEPSRFTLVLGKSRMGPTAEWDVWWDPQTQAVTEQMPWAS